MSSLPLPQSRPVLLLLPLHAAKCLACPLTLAQHLTASPHPQAAADIQLAVSTDYGVSWSESLSFTFYHSYRPPVFQSISPTYVDRAATQPPLLEIIGSNFAPTGPAKLQCGFGGTVVVPAIFVSMTRVRCAAPLAQLQSGNAVVHVRHDGVHWSAFGGRIVLFDGEQPPSVVRVEPKVLPIHTAAAFDVHATNLRPSPSGLSCRFRSVSHLPPSGGGERTAGTITTSPATFVHAQLARCAAPAVSAASQVEVSLSADGGIHFGSGGPSVSYFDPLAEPVVMAASPAFGEAHANTLVTLSGQVRRSHVAPTARIPTPK